MIFIDLAVTKLTPPIKCKKGYVGTHTIVATSRINPKHTMQLGLFQSEETAEIAMAMIKQQLAKDS